jgi:hypothetical protein
MISHVRQNIVAVLEHVQDVRAREKSENLMNKHGMKTR